MRIYHLDRVTGELVGEGEARESPLEPGVFLIPAHATATEPPAAQSGHARVWDGSAWTQVPDHRGETWHTPEGVPVVIETLGTPVTMTVDPPLVVAKAQRIRAAAVTLETRLAGRAISVTTTAGSHSYGVDRGTIDNFQKVTLGILLGTTPNPRPWTPKGALASVMLTHDDLRAVASAVGNDYDGHVQAYLVHKAAISALGSVAAVAAYDITAGWPV